MVNDAPVSPVLFPLLRSALAGGRTDGRRAGGIGPKRPWLNTPPADGAWLYPDAWSLPQMPKPLVMELRNKFQVMQRARTVPLPAVKLWITGITKDSTGAALGNCTVKLFNSLTDVELEQITSDANGNYAFSAIGVGTAYYVVAYKAGSPDVAGTTVNTLVGVA